jgi:zinc finger protein 830
MADVRALLRNERTARRISHPHATYSTTGTLVCLVCHIQLKSESLWNGHLRSPQHAMRLQRIRDGTLGRPPGAPAPDSQLQNESEQDTNNKGKLDATSTKRNGLGGSQSRKRKADKDDEIGDSVSKRGKSDELTEGFSGAGIVEDIKPFKSSNGLSSSMSQGMKLPSRPATPLRTPQVERIPPKVATVDEDEWAAFEADIAATEAPIAEDAVISAPAMSAAELTAKSKEEELARRREQQEAETEGDKEDAARKLEDEFEEMEELEERIRKLKEKRDTLRLRSGDAVAVTQASQALLEEARTTATEDDDDDDGDDDDAWDNFRFNV